MEFTKFTHVDDNAFKKKIVSNFQNLGFENRIRATYTVDHYLDPVKSELKHVTPWDPIYSVVAAEVSSKLSMDARFKTDGVFVLAIPVLTLIKNACRDNFAFTCQT